MSNAARNDRCTYAEGGRRCRRRGEGEPPRCNLHALAEDDEGMEEPGPIASFFERLGGQVDERLSGTGASFLRGVGELFGGVIGDQAEDALAAHLTPEARERIAQQAEEVRRRRAQRRQSGGEGGRERTGRGRDREDQDGAGDAESDLTPEKAREILGIGPDVELTKALIKDRKRKLAELWHPDSGGHPEAMKRANAAAELLLSGL